MNADGDNKKIMDNSNLPSNRSHNQLLNNSSNKPHIGDEPPSSDIDQETIRKAKLTGSFVQNHTNSTQQTPIQSNQRAGGTPPENRINAKVHPMGNQPQQIVQPNQMFPPNNMNQQMMPGNYFMQQQGVPQQVMMMPQQGFPQQPYNANANFRPQIPQQFGNNPGFNRPMQPPGNNLQSVDMMNRFQSDNKAMQNMQATNSNDGAYASTQVCSGACTGWLATYFPCCCCCFEKPYKTVPEGYAAVILRFGKFHASVGPGMHYVLPEVDKLVLINKKEIVVDMKAQTVMSKDNTGFRLDSVLYYKMVNTFVTSFSINNLNHALEDLAATAIRNAVGRMTVQQFLQQKEHFADHIEAEIAPVAKTWGAKVMRVLVQDVYLPADFQNSFSTSAVAKKISEAQVITSKAEVEVARLMRDAADALSTDAAFQIRYISSLEAIQKSNNPKMIFFPADYAEVGKANDHLVNELIEETHSLLKK